MPNLVKLPTWADKTHIYAIVETPRGSHCKLKFDHKRLEFLGWRGPTRAIKIIKRLSR